MTNKEYILDVLIDGGDYGECITQITEYLNSNNVKISSIELIKILEEMVKAGLIEVNVSLQNEYDENPYRLTPKGRKYLSDIK